MICNMMWNFQMEGCNQCGIYLEQSFLNIEENFDSWADNAEYYPDQILSYFGIYYAFIKLVKGEERW